MFINGILIGLASFVITGIFHPVVVKLEYHYGTKSWIWLCIPGIIALIISLFTSTIISIVLGVLSFALFWSCIEIFKQRTRVLQGRARKNPKQNYE